MSSQLRAGGSMDVNICKDPDHRVADPFFFRGQFNDRVGAEPLEFGTLADSFFCDPLSGGHGVFLVFLDNFLMILDHGVAVQC